MKLDSGKLYDKLYARYTLLRLQKDSSVSNADPLEPRSKGVVAEASGHPVFDPTLAALPQYEFRSDVPDSSDHEE